MCSKRRRSLADRGGREISWGLVDGPLVLDREASSRAAWSRRAAPHLRRIPDVTKTAITYARAPPRCAQGSRGRLGRARFTLCGLGPERSSRGRGLRQGRDGLHRGRRQRHRPCASHPRARARRRRGVERRPGTARRARAFPRVRVCAYMYRIRTEDGALRYRTDALPAQLGKGDVTPRRPYDVPQRPSMASSVAPGGGTEVRAHRNADSELVNEDDLGGTSSIT